MTGPKADEFRLKVKQAATGHPWYTQAPLVVWTIFLFTCMCVNIAGIASIRRNRSFFLSSSYLNLLQPIISIG